MLRKVTAISLTKFLRPKLSHKIGHLYFEIYQLGRNRMYLMDGKEKNRGKYCRKNPLRNMKKGQEKRDWFYEWNQFALTGGLVVSKQWKNPNSFRFRGILVLSKNVKIWRLFPSKHQSEVSHPEFLMLTYVSLPTSSV